MFRFFSFIVIVIALINAIEDVYCEPVDCGGRMKQCPYGYEKQNGCEICKCYDPCHPSGKGMLCSANEQCLIDQNAIARCESIQFEQSQNICQLEKSVGNCKGLIERFYHNSATGQCEEFIYGGCGGNENNFKTIDECQKNCMNN